MTRQDIINYSREQMQGNVTYTIRPHLSHQGKEGNIYKLHFTAFYSSERGEKGYPRVEFWGFKEGDNNISIK